MKCDLPVPDGPQTRAPRARSIHSSVAAPAGSGRGSRTVGFPGVERLAGRQPGRAAAWSGSLPGRGRRPPRRAGRAGLRRVPSVGGRGGDHLRRCPADVWAAADDAAAARARRGAVAGSGVLTVIGVVLIRSACSASSAVRARAGGRGCCPARRRGQRGSRRIAVGIVAEDQLDRLPAAAIVEIDGPERVQRDADVSRTRVIARAPPSCGSSLAASAPPSGRGTGSAPRRPAAGGPGSTRGRRHRTGPPARTPRAPGRPRRCRAAWRDRPLRPSCAAPARHPPLRP